MPLGVEVQRLPASEGVRLLLLGVASAQPLLVLSVPDAQIELGRICLLFEGMLWKVDLLSLEVDEVLKVESDPIAGLHFG